ncbi:hypothetical protein FOZ63_025274, partial [Perkinsus olseni]
MLTSYYLSSWGTRRRPSSSSSPWSCSCEICCEGFATINRRPMVLVNCGHTICEMCLDSLVAHSLEDPSNNNDNDIYDPDTGMTKLSPDASIRCPFCRERTEIAAVRPNYVLIQANQHQQQQQRRGRTRSPTTTTDDDVK